MLTTWLTFCLAAHARAEGNDKQFFPHNTAHFPSHQELSEGPMRVRLLPGASTQGMMISAYHPGETSSRNLVEAVKRLKVGDSWFCGFCDPTLKAFKPYLDTGWPVAPYFDQTLVFKNELKKDKDFAKTLSRIEKGGETKLLAFGVGEWENALWIWWEPATAFRDREVVFGISMKDASRLDRKEFHERVLATHRRWKSDLGGRLSSMTGYGMFSHLIGEVGVEALGIETAENIPATQVKRAFVRGAARQFGLPWTEDVSPWFGPAIAVGRPATQPVGADGIYRGANAGHSPSMLERMWATAWFSGAASVIIEAGSSLLFDVENGFGEFPSHAGLSEYGRRAQRLFQLMKNENIGVPNTPFAVLVNKYHGRWSVWGRPWGCLEETVGDMMLVRFFDQLFPGQSLKAGNEERYLCPSPFGDTFDVIVNDADRRSWSAYPAILAVGDIPWTREDIQYLKDYVQSGGILALNEINTNGWDRTYLGLAPTEFAPAGDAAAILASNSGKALLIRHIIGKGYVFVSSPKPEPGVSEERAFPNILLQSLAASFLPFHIEGNVETLVNRTASGWALMIVNNSGFSKTHREAPKVDSSQTQHVVVSYRGSRAKMIDLQSDEELTSVPIDTLNGSLRFDLKPGELRIIKMEVSTAQ